MSWPRSRRRRPPRVARPAAARSPAWALAVILALVCIVAGLVSGRPDTVALGAPFAIIALAGRTGGRARGHAEDLPAVRITVDRRAEAGNRLLRLVLAPRSSGTHRPRRLVATTLAAPGCPPDALVLREDEECPLLVLAPLSGEADVLSYGTALLSADLAGTGSFVPAQPVRVSILPPVGPSLARPVSRRLVGLAGTHASRRPGEGGELRAVTPLQPGDQLRRMDWRATARRSTDQDRLMVRRTFADAEASVFLVLDQGHDLPESTADWFAAGPPHLAPGSLHVARTAATAVAASYLAVGDRVALDDLSGTRRALRSAAGARHLELIRTRLAGTSVVPRRRRRRDPVPPPGAVVVVFSAFLDAEPARLLRLWHAQGHLVAGVDCVPPLRRTESTTAQAQAVRLTLLRRRLLLDELRGEGIPVFSGSTAVPPRAAPGADPAASTARDADAGTGPDQNPDADSGTSLDAGLRMLARRSARRGGQGTRSGRAR